MKRKRSRRRSSREGGRDAVQRAWTYEAPRTFVYLFYGLLTVWTVFCASLLGARIVQGGWFTLTKIFIIAFVMFYTWYFSVGISYRVELSGEGSLRLTSFRRTLDLTLDQVDRVECPYLPIGFVKFRLERQKAYLFCVGTSPRFHDLLRALMALKPDLRVRGLGT